MKQAEHTPWTDEERAMLRRLRANGVSLRQIGVMMGRSFHSVQRQSRYLGLKLPAPAPPDRTHKAGHGIRAGKVTLPPLASLRED